MLENGYPPKATKETRIVTCRSSTTTNAVSLPPSHLPTSKIESSSLHPIISRHVHAQGSFFDPLRESFVGSFVSLISIGSTYGSHVSCQ